MISFWETCMGFTRFTRAECASWVQTWATVAAIIGSVYAVNRAHRLASEREDRAAAKSYDKFVVNLAHLVRMAYLQASEIDGEEAGRHMSLGKLPNAHPQRAELLAYAKTRCLTWLSANEMLAAALSKFEMARVDRRELLTPFLTADQFTRLIQRHLEKASDPAFDWSIHGQELLPIAIAYKPKLFEGLQVLRKFLEERGAEDIPR